ncbi:MAG TPA: aminoacyl-tRNA hydrolase [Candidatus Baltobacteraceae bacterium]|nr:aminoacyl-tRNA hydrolase [Candidatus Baltobacteraceae bacterium]
MVVGLGNPGSKYERTRHNAGFLAVDEVARRLRIENWKTKDAARQAYDSARKIVLVQPQSFMNNSGVPVRLLASWYRTPPQALLVIYDDMDLPFGRIRMRPFGGHGGHNGMRSIIATMGDQFPRLRIGVGRPEYESIDHVLSPFTAQETAHLPEVIGASADTVQRWLDQGIESAMQFINNWEGPIQ